MKRLACAATLALCALPQSAYAFTAAEYLNLTEQGRIGFMAGAIEMAALDAGKGRGGCITDWYFESGKAPMQIAQLFDQYKDKPAVVILKYLINEACGKE